MVTMTAGTVVGGGASVGTVGAAGTGVRVAATSVTAVGVAVDRRVARVGGVSAVACSSTLVGIGTVGTDETSGATVMSIGTGASSKTMPVL